MDIVERPLVRPQELSALLMELAKFGKPILGVWGKGWHCSVEMNTNTTGTSFDVKSDFGMSAPLAAVVQCRERIEAAMKQLVRPA